MIGEKRRPLFNCCLVLTVILRYIYINTMKMTFIFRVVIVNKHVSYYKFTSKQSKAFWLKTSLDFVYSCCITTWSKSIKKSKSSSLYWYNRLPLFQISKRKNLPLFNKSFFSSTSKTYKFSVSFFCVYWG